MLDWEGGKATGQNPSGTQNGLARTIRAPERGSPVASAIAASQLRIQVVRSSSRHHDFSSA